MNTKYLTWTKNLILFTGLILFLYAIYLDRFETSLIFGFISILMWMIVVLIWESEKNYKTIGNTLIVAGFTLTFFFFSI